MLSDAAVKLQEGLTRLAAAGDDEGLLGLALVSLHGALEEHFREQLAREIAAGTQPRPSWLELVDLWQKHRYLSPEDRTLILTTNSKRIQIAHGSSFQLSRSEVERYATFVQKFLGVRARPARRWLEDSASLHDEVGVADSPLAQLLARLRALPGGWLAKMVVVGVVAFVSFWFWQSWLVSLGLTAVILYLVHHQRWLRAAYLYVAGLVYGYVTAVLGVTMMVAIVAALCWPLSAGYFYLTGGSMDFSLPELIMPPIDQQQLEEFILVVPTMVEIGGEATAVFEPTAEATPSPALQVQVRGNSNVRAEPTTSAAVLLIVGDGEVYNVLGVSDDGDWYNILLPSGQEGWIGSSRVVELRP